MAVAKVRILPRAERELLALPEATRDRLVESLDLLADFPHLGVAMVGAFNGYGCLMAAGGRYRVIYKVVSATRLDIAWFRHPRRQIGLRPV